MTDVIMDEAVGESADEEAVVRLDDLDQQLVGQLVDRARSQGLQLTGEGGLLAQLTKTIIESAAEGELDDHLGYGKHDPAGRDGGNSRNGSRVKTVLTDIGPVEVAIPRDREGTFEPQIVRQCRRRLCGLDPLVISLSAKGLTHGEICAHLAEVYGAQVCKQTISRSGRLSGFRRHRLATARSAEMQHMKYKPWKHNYLQTCSMAVVR